MSAVKSKNSTKLSLKLHLGCGKRYLPGFIHVDLDDFPFIDYRHGIDKLPMFKDNSADEIYACHAFEYFDRPTAMKVLKEWKRVLKNGGVVKLALPDFQSITKIYLKYKDLDQRGILGPLYGRIEIKVGRKMGYVYHKTAYDFKSLKKLLLGVGFKNIKRYSWRKFLPKDYDDFSRAYIPHMDEKKGILISLNVQAEK